MTEKKVYHSDDYQSFVGDHLVVDETVPRKLFAFLISLIILIWTFSGVMNMGMQTLRPWLLRLVGSMICGGLFV